MQDIHSIGTVGGGGGGGGSRIFGGGVDRRLRTHNTLNHQQALKCPRCESVNTKFCYYNNYNLSQPRHFCKGCRRYWTRGGVLRNVPVGGGCRKPKRSAKPKQQPPPSSSDVVAPPRRSNSHNSSSESSTTTAAGEVISGGSSSTVCPRLFNFPSESEFGSLNQTMEGGGPILSEEIGRLSEMMTSSAEEMWSYRSEENKVVENGKRDEIEELPYMNDQMEFSESEKRGGMGMGWGVEAIFDQPLPFWNQTQWPDHSFNYLP